MVLFVVFFNGFLCVFHCILHVFSLFFMFFHDVSALLGLTSRPDDVAVAQVGSAGRVSR